MTRLALILLLNCIPRIVESLKNERLDSIAIHTLLTKNSQGNIKLNKKDFILHGQLLLKETALIIYQFKNRLTIQMNYLIFSVIFTIFFFSFDSFAWESQLFFKKNNKFNFAKVNGFELPDFSYAGYHSGERDIPNVPINKEIFPIQGDNVKHIQSALYAAQGGALLLKPGTYKIKSEIVIPGNTVLRGSGTDKTFIFVDTNNTSKRSFLVGNRSLNTNPKISTWSYYEGKNIPVISDLASKSTSFIIKDSSKLSVGDWIIIKNKVTDAFRLEYNGIVEDNGEKIWPGDYSSIKFLRQILKINDNRITIDTPIRHSLKVRDSASVIKTTCLSEEIGIENLSIGFQIPPDKDIYHNTKSAGENSSYHASGAIVFGNVINGWIRNVKSYCPSGDNFHLHSRGIQISNSRFITVENCDLSSPVNIGGGGNGYLYTLAMCNDCLLTNCVARRGRHNFLFCLASSGNVISNCKSFDSFLPNDFHHSLSIANLIESMDVISTDVTSMSKFKYAWVIKNRKRESAGAGFTGLNNVFWRINIYPNNHTILSEQADANQGKGYIIGSTATSEPTKIKGTEWREGIGNVEDLEPISLYKEQLKLRLSRLKPPSLRFAF